MAWNDHKRNKVQLAKSFTYAFSGIKSAFISERNVKIHGSISIIVILFGFLFHIEITEWIVVILLIGGMITCELMNTAIEKTVDLVTEEFHPLAKLAKDIAAGAVLTFTITSVIIGLLIFIPYFYGILKILTI